MQNLEHIREISLQNDARIEVLSAWVTQNELESVNREVKVVVFLHIEVDESWWRNSSSSIDEIRQDPELLGINVLVWMNQGEEIRGSLRGLRNAGIFGGLLAILVLFLFLRRISTTLIVAVAINLVMLKLK